MNGRGKWRWIVPGALVVALALSGSTLAAPVGQITEFPTPSTTSGPEGMAPGPDGNLWFAELGKSTIARGQPGHRSSEFTTLRRPVANARRRARALTATSGSPRSGRARSARSTRPRTSSRSSPTKTPNSGPVAIIAGPERQHVVHRKPRAIRSARSTRARTSSRSFPLPPRPAFRSGSPPDPTGTSGLPRRTRTRSARSTRPPHLVTEFAVPTASSQPNAIAAGPNGTLWFTEQAAQARSRCSTPRPIR